MIPVVCAAQSDQFRNLPDVRATGGRVTSFRTGTFQQPSSGGIDILYINAPVVSGTTPSVTAGIMLDGQGFTNLPGNQIQFANTTNVIAALGDYNGDQTTDFAFAYVPQGSNNIELCVYYGTGATAAQAASGQSSFSGLNDTSGCLVIPSRQTLPPVLSNMASFPLQAGGVAQLLLEDSANNILYIIANSGKTGSNGNLQGFAAQVAVLPDGAGPIYVGDFNGDGHTDFIINGQAGLSASVYISSVGNSFFVPSHIYKFDHGVQSMLMQDMDRDGIADMVVEGSNGVIEVFKGNGDGTFQTTSMGGTALSPGSVAGEGGRLVAINPNTREILTATPIGLSLLDGSGSLSYLLKTIYNIGPGRNSFALVDFNGTGNLDLAVNSEEGVAIIPGNPDGTFLASHAYSALAPGLGAVVGQFRNLANNPKSAQDVVVGTGATQAQLLTGDGTGKFVTFPGVINTTGGPTVNLWSNILSGDFNGDKNLDIAYSLTGLPVPAQGAGSGPGLYIQNGNGDGTFARITPVSTTPAVPSNNTFYGESVVGDFNGDQLADIANIDPGYDDTLLGQPSAGPFLLGMNLLDSNNTSFNQVAAGFFTGNRTSQQDLIFQEGANFIPYVNMVDGSGKNFKAMPVLTGPGAPLYPSTVLLTDMDGDGFGDLVVVYYNTAPNPVGAGPSGPYVVYIWYGKGDGTFEAPQILSLSRNYYLGAVADMNADGLPDIVLSDGSLVSILYNQGKGSFGAVQSNGELAGEQHFLAGQGINSISLADVNGDGLPDLIATNGGATISNPVVLGGKTASSISLTQNPADINTGGITVLMNSINSKPPTGNLVAMPEPSTYQATFQLIATLIPAKNVAAPTGLVQFYIDEKPLGSPVNLRPGTTSSTATYTVAAGNSYAGKVHPIGAQYYGDTANSQAAFLGTHTILGGAPTTTDLFLCVGPTAACPVGTVLPPLATLLTMSYGQFWNGTVDVTASDNTALLGDTVIYDSYNNGPPLPICSLPTATGGTCDPSVGTTVGTGAGTNVITAAYVPGTADPNHAGSTSNAVTINVLPDTTTATLGGAPNPSPAGQPVTFTATVSGNFAAPTGPVNIVELFPPTNSAVVLGTATLVPGPGLTSTATFTTSALPLGTDSIQAQYAATLDFDGSSSPVFLETITPSLAGNFTLSVAPTPVSVGVGYSTLLTVTVTPQNGFSQRVNLACANLPSEATCFFDAANLAGGGGTTSLVVGTTAPHSCGTTQPYFLGANGGGTGIAPIALPAIASLLAMFLPGRRRWLRALIALIVVAAATQMTGCGNCTDLGTRPATYTFQVTGTSTGTSEVQAQSVTITVTI